MPKAAAPTTRIVELPEVEVYARVHGGMEYICPSCGKVHGYTVLRFRYPRIRCKNEDCDATFIMGLMIGSVGDVGLPAGNAKVAERPGKIICINKRKAPEGVAGYAHIRGGIWWLCQDCGDWVYDIPDWDTGQIVCPKCSKIEHTGLIFYPAPRHPWPTTPVDWVPPRGRYVQDISKSIYPPKSHPSSGEAGESIGGSGEDSSNSVEDPGGN
jgi:hypothetical protein